MTPYLDNDLLDDLPMNKPEEDESPTFFEIADRLCELYVTYRRRYVMMINGSIFIPKKDGPVALSNSVICKHLNKKLAIGVFAGEYSSKFVCFDVDDGNQETVRTILSLAEQFGIPRKYLYVSSSGGKGYHVEVFFDTLVYTEKLRIFYEWIIRKGKLNPGKVEFRPTHMQAIKLPLSKHVKTGNVCWFLDRETFAPFEYESYICEIEQYSASEFNALVDQCGIRKPVLDDSDDIDVILNMPCARMLTQQEQDVIAGTCPFPDITQPGQRHHLTRSIAIHNRSIGMSMEESTEALLKWWSVQDKTITNTPDSEAIEDIHELVAWTFSDAFIVPHRTKKLSITKDMIRLCLSQETKTERKLMFLIACFCSAYGRMNMSYDRIAKYLDCSAISVRKILPKMVDNGWVRRVCGRSTSVGGKFVRKPNTYWINDEKCSELQNMKIQWAFDEPLVYEAQEDSDTDNAGRMRTFIPELEPEGFTEFYYDMIRRTVSKKSYKDFLTRSEISSLTVRQTA